METINNRIEQLISALNITKTSFAEKVKVSQQYISKLIRTGTPSDLLLDDICEIFNVSIDWLKYGNGSMFIELPEEDEYFKAATLICKKGDELAMRAIIEYWKLDSDSKQLFWDFLKKITS